MKNILIIPGGGRPNGNAKQSIDVFTKGAIEAGHKAGLISLNKLAVKGCMECNACRYGKPCIQKDDFSNLIPKIKTTDCIVFASLLLFWTYDRQFLITNLRLSTISAFVAGECC